jgi:hypothetical protein
MTKSCSHNKIRLHPQPPTKIPKLLYNGRHMTRIIALSPKKNTKTRPYKSPKRLAAKKEMLAAKAAKKGRGRSTTTTK